MRVLAAAGIDPTLVQLFLGVLTIFGGGGAWIAAVKLKPDMTSQAVSQSGLAVENLAKLQKETAEDRDQWRARALAAEQDAATCRSELRAIERDLDDVTAKLDACREGHRRRERGV